MIRLFSFLFSLLLCAAIAQAVEKPAPTTAPDKPVVAESAEKPAPTTAPDKPVVAESAEKPAPTTAPDKPVVAEPVEKPVTQAIEAEDTVVETTEEGATKEETAEEAATAAQPPTPGEEKIIQKSASKVLETVGLKKKEPEKPEFVYETCSNLPTFAALDCEDDKSIVAALSELHTCMKSRFTYKDQIYAAAWPEIEVPEKGPIVGGGADWAIGCLQVWPCTEKRLAFVEELGKEPHLAFIVNTHVVHFEMDKVMEKKDLKKHLVLRISGLDKDDPWYTVDKKQE